LYNLLNLVFWNSDKPVYQKEMANRVAALFKLEYGSYEIWLKTLLLEFMKKWIDIDFLRLDKYAMLIQTIIKKYLDDCLINEKYSMILEIFNYLSKSHHSGTYNYNFVNIVISSISQFLNGLNDIDEAFYSNILKTVIKVKFT
jgi:hypothetical protein